MHNFLYKLRKIKFLYMFRASSAHLQEVKLKICNHDVLEDESVHGADSSSRSRGNFS